VSLPAFLRGVLEAHLAAHFPGGAGPDALVFQSITGTAIRHNQLYKRYFKPAVEGTPAREAEPARRGRRATPARPAVPGALPPEKHGLRFHDLRHTCAALLIAAGAHSKAIQQRLGHSSIQITMDRYGHLLPDADDRLADVLDATHAAASAPSNVRSIRAAE
jgi:integrase